MHIAKQLAIFLDNRPGMLARVADALAEARINIYAISTSDTVDHIVIRLVVSDYRRAIHVFESHGALVVEDDVLMVEGDNINLPTQRSTSNTPTLPRRRTRGRAC